MTNIVTLRFENLLISSRHFSRSKDLSLDGLAMEAECLREDFSSKLYILKWVGKTPVVRPRTRWFEYIEDLGWNRLGLYPSEMQFVLVDRKLWRLNLELLSPQPSKKSGWRKKEKKRQHFCISPLFLLSLNSFASRDIAATPIHYL